MNIIILQAFLRNPTFLAYVAVISLLVTIISAFLAIYFYKKQKKEEKIVIQYGLSSPIDIGQGLSNIFKDFRMTFNNNPIEDNIQYIEGKLINVSEKDITTIEEYNSISLELPESYSIIDVQITNITLTNKEKQIKSNIHKVEKTHSNNTIEFEMPKVFYAKESIYFSAIYKASSNESLTAHFQTNIPNVSLQYEFSKDANPVSYLKKYSIDKVIMYSVGLFICTFLLTILFKNIQMSLYSDAFILETMTMTILLLLLVLLIIIIPLIFDKLVKKYINHFQALSKKNDEE